MEGSVLILLCGGVRKLTPEERENYPDYYYVTTSESRFEHNGRTIEVPIGFLTDGSSGAPDYGRSWLFHDFLYSTHEFESGEICTRSEADQVMKQILLHENMGWYCWLFQKAALFNPFWIFSSAWVRSGLRGPEYFEMELPSVLEEEEEAL